jgi:hypothetical protein
MKARNLWRTLVIPLLMGSAFAFGTARLGIALAEVDNWNHAANCNNWHPHTWSVYSWSSAPSNTNALSEATLKEWNYSTNSYQTMVDTVSNFQEGGSGSVSADAYESTYEYGTGTWQAIDQYAEDYGSSYGPSGIVYAYPSCG